MSSQYVFELKNIFIATVNFCRNPDFDSSKGAISINTKINVGYDYKDKKDLVVSVKAMLEEGDNMPFAFSVEAVGVFRFKTQPPEEIIDKVARMNCAAIVFPYVREAVADLTRRSGLTPLHLQPANFVALYEALQSAKLKGSENGGLKAIKKTAAKTSSKKN